MIKRHITNKILESLTDTPVFFLQGARQVGKSTLVQALSKAGHESEYLTLDDATILTAAQADPTGFIAGLSEPVIIDEVQRAPALLPAIKAAVDKERKPGRFILTGSANVLLLPKVSESLAGRMELHTLWPFSQGELGGRLETFVDRLFKEQLRKPELIDTFDIFEQAMRGGYPEIQSRSQARQRDWFGSYVTTILQRDVRDMANIQGLTELPQLLRLLAARSAQLLNYSDLARSMTIPQSTLKRYMALLEATFLVQLLPTWFTNTGKRLVKAPKLIMVDTGLMASLLGIDTRRLEVDPALKGRLLENFVIMEIRKQAAWSQTRPELFHYRTHSQHEVDLVLEDASGGIVGIEIKTSSTIKASDLKGLHDLAESAGDRFLRGVILYLGDKVVPMGANLHAMPVQNLWA